MFVGVFVQKSTGLRAGLRAVPDLASRQQVDRLRGRAA